MVSPSGSVAHRQPLSFAKYWEHRRQPHKCKAVKGVTQPLYDNADKSNRTIKGEISLKKFLASINAAHLDLEVTSNKKELLMSIDWKPVVRLEVESSTSVVLEWNAGVVERYKTKQAEFEDSFREVMGAGAGLTCTRS